MERRKGIYFDEDDRGATSSNEGLMRKRFLSETEEEEGGETSSDLFEIKLDDHDDYEGSWFSFDFRKWNDYVYVAVGDNAVSAMDALKWTLNHAVSFSTRVYLVHISPEIRCVPSPLGMLPKSQVSPRLVEKYMAEEKEKRKEFLHKFVDLCSAAQVKVEVLMIEKDMVAKAILNLIRIIHIRKLILGSTKARKWRSRRGRSIAKQVLQNADEFCEVKVICEGKEITNNIIGSSSSPEILSSNSSDNNDSINLKTMQKEHRLSDYFSCLHFGF